MPELGLGFFARRTILKRGNDGLVSRQRPAQLEGFLGAIDPGLLDLLDDAIEQAGKLGRVGFADLPLRCCDERNGHDSDGSHDREGHLRLEAWAAYHGRMGQTPEASGGCGDPTTARGRVNWSCALL